MGKTSNEYIHNLARTLMGQLGIRAEDWEDHQKWPDRSRKYALQGQGESAFLHTFRKLLARALAYQYANDIEKIIVRFPYRKIGLIAACGPPASDGGQTTIAEVSGDVFPMSFGGAAIVLFLAEFAVIAAMTDNLLADIKKLREELESREGKLDP